MRVTNSAIAVALGSILLACATPPPPEGSSSGLAMHIKARSPLRFLPALFDQVLFVRLDESKDDPLLGTSIFYSNYENDGYFYLLNPLPGRYVAVAAVATSALPELPEAPPPYFDKKEGKWNTDTPTGFRPWGSLPPSSINQTIYFDEDLVRQTEVTVRPGSLMGEFLVHTALLRDSDPVQSHYLRLLQPGHSKNWMVQSLLSSKIYSGRGAGAKKDEAASEKFSRKASEHLMNAGWKEILKGMEEGPTP